MTIIKKLGALTGASALVAAGLVAFAGQSASAADFGIGWDADYYLPGDTAVLTAVGCAPGNVVEFYLPGEDEVIEVDVYEDGDIPAQSVDIPEDVAGELFAYAICITPAWGEEPEEEVDAEAEAYILDKTLTAVPSQFQLGDPVEITAGEFVPGALVTLRVNTIDGEETLWSHEMGYAGEDRLAVSDVTFPTTLACGLYNVHVSSSGAVVDNFVEADLTLCGAAASPSPSPSTSPSASASPTAPATPTATATPGKPGLPSSGH